MLFNSYPFLLLVLVTLILYYTVFSKQQVWVLIISSAVFYGYSQPYLLLLLFLSGSANAVASYVVYHEPHPDKRRAVAILGVIFNLAVLVGFKYNHLLGGIFITGDDSFFSFALMLPLPIGISFYTFQGISLVMDVYKPLGDYDIKISESFYRHYLNTIFFISFFPQLVAGPIVKAHSFYPQITQKKFSQIDFYYVYKLLVLGYFLKLVIADNLKDQTFWISAPWFEIQSSLTLLVMLFGFSMQIFSDFAGYSLIAIGVAALFGYKLPKNFDFPYISVSITDFWRRWHLSLSSWLKEYLYIGLLGGNRIGRVRTYVNLVVVMFLGGLWHGAAISYGVWGLWHGVGLALERRFSPVTFGLIKKKSLNTFLRILFVFTFVSFGWLLFKLPNFGEAVRYVLSIVNNMNMPHNDVVIITIVLYSLPVVMYHVLYLMRDAGLYGKIRRFDYLALAILLFMVIINSGLPGEFIYFQF